LALGSGDEIDIGIEIADQRYRPALEIDALSENREPAANQLEAAHGLDGVDIAGDPNVAPDLGVETAPAQENLVGCRNREIEGEWNGRRRSACGTFIDARARQRL